MGIELFWTVKLRFFFFLIFKIEFMVSLGNFGWCFLIIIVIIFIIIIIIIFALFSFKKSNNNAQGGQSRADVPSVHSSDSTNAAVPRGAQNGAHTQPQLQVSKQVEPSFTQRSSRPVPKDPTSQSSSVSPDTAATNTPTKAPGDGTRAFPFRFGSIRPGFMNGMQIPARAGSAPPNLDEQKRDQARHDSYRSAPPVPTPSVPKQQLPRKDPGGVDQLNTAEAHPVPKPKKDVQVSPAPSSQSRKPSGLPMTGISMPMPFHQPPVPVQFGGPNQQIQSQGVSAPSLQMPMPMQLPMGSAPQVQQQVFVQALQPHPMPPQGIMHQVPSLGFTAQMGQLPPQLGNLEMGTAHQFPQQQGTKFGGHRKTPVKFTHPETHRELRFDKLTDAYPGGGSSGGGGLNATSKNDGGNVENVGGGGVSAENTDAAGASVPQSGSKDKPLIELNRSKSTVSNGKKKRREILQKADAARTTSDGGNVENVGGGGVSAENIDAAGVSVPQSGSKDKPLIELNRSKCPVAKGKKNRREILQKADAAGTTSELYMAYKGPEEKKEVLISSESTESISGNINLKHLAADEPHEDPVLSEKDSQGKVEPDDWEDAADISKPKLETSDNGEQVHGDMVHDDKYGMGNMAKKYSRDFLLKFADQFNDLPEGFEIKSEIAEVLNNANISSPHLVERDSFSSPGRGAPRLEQCGSGLIDDDKWSKQPGSSGSGHLRLDLAFGPGGGLRPGQLVNYGVLRRPLQYPGVLASPMQSVGSQGMQRNSPDADRWQRATNFHKGLIPSPQTPLQKMHKAEKKYEVGKITDEEQAKQRQLKAILNKLTPQNFEKLFEQVKAVNIDNAVTLTGVINQIFDKALMEPTFCEMYANFCYHLAGELPDLTFKRLLLNKCQEEFERGEREQEEANKADEEGEIKQSEEEREKRIKARRRMLGNIRLIGELYKKKILTERIMHECIKKLLGNYQNPDEEDVEALCKLMSTIGGMIDHPKAKEHMDAYFDRMKSLSNNMKLSSRVRFMLKDSIDLRKNKK